ncbi:ParB/RepB/Spo0J family partition protein [Streptomyces purpurascens]|uniref:ParB/RepB/Spo0J family partition protein n=1 Tax=Streptomyces purpurascens TaxID=1924 RepID=UPI001676C4F0|nr:plasmid partitioning protein [Streptomyces purpurascens]MCE7051896.1 plasmid partitioning protein [Streptomyces purpurascens]GHA59228.1 plasmid partitioning protein [Streptomyces purpurascens]
MSVADRLGTGSSFNGNRRSRSARGRAKAVTQGDVPVYELVRLRLSEVSPTPLNPRRNFGTEEDKTRFGEELRQAQLAACVAVTRTAYLALWPDHEDRIGAADHVLVNGERRFHSAVHVGLEALDFVVRDDLASSREEFINHLLKENLEREDFDVIERARGVEQLVAVCAETAERGARTRAAEQLGKDRSWVTNQLVLLDLPAELQSMLSAGSLPERDGRTLARYAKDNPGLEASGLLDHLKAAKEAAALAKAEERLKLQALRSGKNNVLLSADNKTGEQEPPVTDTEPGGPAADSQGESLLSADNKSDSESEAPQTRTGSLSADNKSADRPLRAAKPPAQRQASQDTASSSSAADRAEAVSDEPEQDNGEQPRKLPYDDPFYVVQHLHVKMATADFVNGGRVWMAVLREQHPEEYQALLRELGQQEQQSA